eukprot:1280643-Alexandrium_andersonii.AAC.1
MSASLVGSEMCIRDSVRRLRGAQVLQAHLEVSHRARGQDILGVEVRSKGRVEARHLRALLAPTEPMAQGAP